MEGIQSEPIRQEESAASLIPKTAPIPTPIPTPKPTPPEPKPNPNSGTEQLRLVAEQVQTQTTGERVYRVNQKAQRFQHDQQEETVRKRQRTNEQPQQTKTETHVNPEDMS